MAYIESMLKPGERIIYRARVGWAAHATQLALLCTIMSLGIFKLLRTRLALTDKRVIGETGFFNHKHLALEYAQVELVRMQQGVLGKLFNYGSVTIIGKDGGKVKFPGIAWPLDVQMQIEEANEMAVLGRKLSQTVMEKF